MAISDCLAPCAKRRRHDTVRLFALYGNMSRRKAQRVLMHLTSEDEAVYDCILRRIAHDLSEEIREERVVLPSVRQDWREDGSSGKKRLITVLDVKQLLLDHVAVFCLEELSKRIGKYQVSSIVGRGATFGMKAVKKWLKNKRMKYSVKLDIKNFYGSVDRGLLMEWLGKHIKNAKLMHLIGVLISNIDEGIAIGSYLSQTLANIYLSDIYHAVDVPHKLFYMDDMLFLHTNKRKLKRAVAIAVEKAAELGLRVKTNWCVNKISKNNPIDMMGFRFSHYLTTMRKRVFKRFRRVVLHSLRSRHLTKKQARRVNSFGGFLKVTDLKKFTNGNKVQRVLHHAGLVVSKVDG